MPNNMDKLTALTEKLADKTDVYHELENMFDTCLSLMCVAGLDGYFKKVSKSWVKALGWTQEELCGSPWLSFVHPEDYEITAHVGSMMVAGVPVTLFINRYRCKDGSYRKILWNAPGFTPTGISYASAVDITDMAGIQ